MKCVYSAGILSIQRYTYIDISMHTYACMPTYIHIHMHIPTHIYTHTYTYLHIYSHHPYMPYNTIDCDTNYSTQITTIVIAHEDVICQNHDHF